MNKVLIFSLPLILALAGCSNQPYPKSWPEPANQLQPNGCRGLIGTYQDIPTPESFDKTGLFDHVTKYSGHLRQMDFVKIESPEDGVLKFVAYENGTKLEEFVVSEAKKSLICNEWGATLPMSGVRGAEEVLIISKKTIFIRKDTSGSLLLNDNETGVGFYGVIPFPGSQVLWYRYLPYIQGNN